MQARELEADASDTAEARVVTAAAKVVPVVVVTAVLALSHTAAAAPLHVHA